MAGMSEAFLQMTLARDANWLSRLQVCMVTAARTVKDEAAEVAGHSQRSAYATNVINNPASTAQSASVMLVGGDLLRGTITLTDSGPVTSATDANVMEQIYTFWNVLSGLDKNAMPTPPTVVAAAPSMTPPGA